MTSGSVQGSGRGTQAQTAHVGKPTLAMRAREGDAIPVGTGHPVRPALVTPAPLSLL